MSIGYTPRPIEDLSTSTSLCNGGCISTIHVAILTHFGLY